MTLVPNRLLPLNGSRAIILILVAVLLWQCNPSRKTTRTRPPVRDKTERPPVDTATWEESDDPDQVIKVDPDVKDPFTTKKIGPRDASLSIILPINSGNLANKSGHFSGSEEAVLHYYAGYLIGLEELSRNGHDFRVSIADVHQDDARLKTVLTQAKRDNKNFVFGGLGHEQVKEIAEFVDKEDMIYVNGWQSNSDFVGQNRHYFQLKPGFQAHVNKILRHAMSEFKADQIIVFGSDAEKKRIDRINETYQSMFNSSDLLHTFTVETVEDLELLKMEEWQEKAEKRKLVFIVPVTRNIDLIHDFFRFLEYNGLGDQSVIYGITSWNDEKLYGFLENYDVRLTSFQNPDAVLSETSFQEKFYAKTGVLPGLRALEGYGHAHLMVEFMKSFQSKKTQLKEYEGPGMKARFVDHNDILHSTSDRKSSTSSYFENEAVQLLGFRNFRYHLFDY